jgi:hypothetical protein
LLQAGTREFFMKNVMARGAVVCLLVAAAFTLYLHARSKQSTGYQPATVMSVEQLDTMPDPMVGSNPSDAPMAPTEYAYNIGLKLTCTLYMGRYESATDYLPVYFKPNRSVDVRLEKHWIYVSLPEDREVKLALTSHSPVHDQACAQ